MFKKKINQLRITLKTYKLFLLHGKYGKRLKIIAITGTSGKTTTAIMLHKILQQAGYKTGLISTSQHSVGGNKNTKNIINVTTPDAHTLRRLIGEMEENDCTHAVIEVSSHALRDNRIIGLSFDCVSVTNIHPDHMDDFHTMENYVAAKALVFKSKPSVSLINGDNAYAGYLKSKASGKIVTFGKKRTNNYIASHISVTKNGQRFRVHSGAQKHDLSLKLDGDFQIDNALAAFAISRQFGVQAKAAINSLSDISSVSGRMEKIDQGQAFKVYIDYAHNGIEFEHVITAARKLSKGKIITVFGAAGEYGKDRWRDKGRVAGRLSDIVIITDDEPGTVDPKHIRNSVATYALEAGASRLFNIAGRKNAIQKAFSLAETDDLVLVLSLGDQSSRLINGTYKPWDERGVSVALLK